MININLLNKLMKEAKAKNLRVTYSSGNDRLFVEYSDKHNIYIFRYSWIIDNLQSEFATKIMNDDSEFYSLFANKPWYYKENKEITNTEVLQVGMITILSENSNSVISDIKASQDGLIEHFKETKYYFLGKKIIRVLQYFRGYFNPIEYIPIIQNWNYTEDSLCNIEFKKIIGGINYKYCDETNEIIFSIGSNISSTVFSVDVKNINLSSLPTVICIDSICGTKEYNISKKL